MLKSFLLLIAIIISFIEPENIVSDGLVSFVVNAWL